MDAIQPVPLRRPKRRAPEGDYVEGDESRKRRCIIRNPTPSAEEAAQQGLLRAIALGLQTVGFSSAQPLALNWFATAVENYMEHFIADLKTSSMTARRDQPIPTDFESTLKLYNTPISSLRDRGQCIEDRQVLEPSFYKVDTKDPDFVRPLPTLGEELSGDIEKKKKEYVPQRFPGFPSKHTFISTLPEEDPTRRDAKKTREAAAQAAKQAEDALRGLLRAAKMSQQKEIRKQVERHTASRDRHSRWEKLMAQKMKEDGLHLDEANDEEFQTGIANYSMIVNWAGDTLRAQVSKGGRRVTKANHDRAIRQGVS